MSTSARERAGFCPALVPVLAGALLGIAARLQPMRGSDLLWQIRTGEEVLRTRGRLATDLFSHAFRGRPIHDHEWAFEAVVAALHRLGGMNLLWAAMMVLVASVLATSTHAARALVPSGAARIVGAAAIAGLIAGRSDPRPELATFAGIAIAHALTRGAVGARRFLPILVTLVAAPFHGLAWWIAVVPVAHAIERRAVVDVACAVGCLLAAIVASPGLVALNVQSVGGTAIVEHIIELRSPLTLLVTRAAILPAAAHLVGVLALVGLVRLSRAGRARTADVALVAMLLVPGLRYARFAPLPLIAAMPWALAGIGALAQPLLRGRLLPLGVPLIMCALSLVVITESYGLHQSVRGFDWESQPVDAVRFLRATRPHAALFHSYNFAPYLIFEGYPPRGVVIDPRAQTLYPNDYAARYYRATAEPAEFEAWMRETPFDAVLLGARHKGTAPLREHLRRSPAWQLAYEDRVSIVFIRRRPSVD